ncbi:MAG: phosphoribosylanthranilate isomerase [Dethiobacter sp.]|jgi:phosphoribosylanthranilate isomerase|nr:MAG: phosphoribosylanthranilate isomerase [Dethiobacter sp.]
MCPVRVKICGITTPREALAAVEEGVHALGFVFAASPRRISPEKAAAIIKELPPFIGKVGVFVNEEDEKVREIAAYCRLDTLQFHGEETAEYCRRFPTYKIIKTFLASSSLSLERCREYLVSAILLDTKYTDKKGGGGQTFNWRLARPFYKRTIPLILAGGLNQENIITALDLLEPYGVDISSGVEKDGLKDKHMIRAFMEQIRRWEYQQLSQ